MAESNRLKALRDRIQKQNGTILDKVEGEVELDDKDANDNPRTGPVLVLQGIEEGACLKIARPRPVTVLGHISGQVFGAYRVKAGSLLSGRLEGARHVDIVYDMSSKGKTNVDSWIVFEGTSDPNFFSQAKTELDLLKILQSQQASGRENSAVGLLYRSMKDVPYDIRFSVPVGGESVLVFALYPGRRDKPIDVKPIPLLRYVLGKIEQESLRVSGEEKLEIFNQALEEVILQGLYRANQGGIGASLRQQKGAEVFEPYAELLHKHLLPILLRMWIKLETSLVQQIVDKLSEVPMRLKVEGQLAPFFQIEYPHWKFRVEDGEIVPEKVADCNIACQAGSSADSMLMTYNYVGEDDWISQTKEIPLEQTKNCSLIFTKGNVYLSDMTNCLFGPAVKEEEVSV